MGYPLTCLRSPDPTITAQERPSLPLLKCYFIHLGKTLPLFKIMLFIYKRPSFKIIYLKSVKIMLFYSFKIMFKVSNGLIIENFENSEMFLHDLYFQ
jgi:hypothetical protein